MGRSDRGQIQAGHRFRRNSATQTMEILLPIDKNDQGTMTIENDDVTFNVLNEGPTDEKPLKTENAPNRPMLDTKQEYAERLQDNNLQEYPPASGNNYNYYPPGNFQPQSNFYEQYDPGYVPHRFDYWHGAYPYISSPHYYYPTPAVYEKSYDINHIEEPRPVVQGVDRQQDKAIKKLEKQMTQLSRICASVIQHRDKRAEMRDSLALQLQSIEQQSAIITELRIKELREKSCFLRLQEEGNQQESLSHFLFPNKFNSRSLNEGKSHPLPLASSKARKYWQKSSKPDAYYIEDDNPSSNSEHVEDKIDGEKNPLIKSKNTNLPIESILEWRKSLLKFYHAIEKLLLRLLSSSYRDSESTFDLLKIRENTINKLRDADEVLEVLQW